MEERIRRKRMLCEERSEEMLWQCVIAYQGYQFYTASGLPFCYGLKTGRNGKLTKELWVDRREGSKSLAWSSVRLAFEHLNDMEKEAGAEPGQLLVERPKALGDIRGVSYIYPLFREFGLIRVPEKVRVRMELERDGAET